MILLRTSRLFNCLKRLLRRLLAMLVLLALVAAAGFVGTGRLAGPLAWPRPPDRQVRERAAWSLLRSEAMAFLVTRRITAQIVVEQAESGWLGDWRGVLWATVHIHYGQDLRKLVPGDVVVDGRVVRVRLPPPEVLSFAVAPGSVRYLTRSTAVCKLDDLLHNGHRHQLECRLRQEAMRFAAAQELTPSREQLVGRLNAAAAGWKEATGLELRFE